MRSEIVAGAFSGFREGRAEDVETVRGWIRTVIRAGNWGFGDADAVAQDVLFQLVRTVRAGRVLDPGSFQKFVYSVSKNVCVDAYHRERTRRLTVPLDHASVEEPAHDPATGSHERIEQRERLRQLGYVFQRLPAGCRELLAWIYGEGAAAAEAARRLNVEVGAVRVRVHRCLKRARDIYQEAGHRS